MIKANAIKLRKLSDEKHVIKPKLNLKWNYITANVKYQKQTRSRNKKDGFKTEARHNWSQGNENIYGSFEGGW